MRKKNCFKVASSPLNHIVCVKPTIVTHPQGQNLDQGDSVTLSVLASGTAPFSYQWFKGDLEMPGETSSELQLLYVDLVNAGVYKVRVSNACGQIFSVNAVVVVNDIGAPSCVAPTIMVHPGGGVKNHGDNITFSVVAAGTGPFTYQWYKDDVAIVGETADELELIYVEQEDEGAYSVNVENDCGEVRSAGGLLVVNSPDTPEGCIAPVITSHPDGVVADPGDDVEFSVGVEGTGPFTYQWKKDNVNLSGETNPTLELIYVQEADQGSYSVVITNACGSISSGTALLAVENPDSGGPSGGSGGAYIGDAGLL